VIDPTLQYTHSLPNRLNYQSICVSDDDQQVPLSTSQ
jgi:hypothetical protein